MNHKANWKELEEVWIELANCVCETEIEIPCLHCDSSAFKIWHQMKFGEAAFTQIANFIVRSKEDIYCPMRSIWGDYKYRINLPSVVYYQADKGWRSNDYSKFFKTVKEVMLCWRDDEPRT